MIKLGRGAGAPPFMAMDVIVRANRLAAALPPGAPPILRLEVGQPGFGAPAGALRAVRAALDAGSALGYTEALGLASLRRRIAAHYCHWYDLDVPPDRIAVTAGASGAFPLAFLTCFDAGDAVAFAAPCYPPYLNILNALGLRPLILQATAEHRFQPTIAALEALSEPPAGLIVASPCNPAGTMLTPSELAALCAWCDTHGVRLISDEIYHGLGYGDPIATAAAFSPHAVVINSFSKYFCMTGWRIGWMLLPEPLIRPVERLSQNLTISAPHISQIAAEAALDCHDELTTHVARYRRNRDRLHAALPATWQAAPPQGAFYLYADMGEHADSPAFCAAALTQIGLACTPGLDFDTARGHRFVRFSYAGAEQDIADAASRLQSWTAGRLDAGNLFGSV